MNNALCVKPISGDARTALMAEEAPSGTGLQKAFTLLTQNSCYPKAVNSCSL